MVAAVRQHLLPAQAEDILQVAQVEVVAVQVAVQEVVAVEAAEAEEEDNSFAKVNKSGRDMFWACLCCFFMCFLFVR